MDFQKIFRDIQLNSIRLQPCTSMQIELGQSKFGGKPHLPVDFEWKHYKGESLFTGEIKERPLSFLAQINMSEVAEFDLDDRLPNSGILYFFYELESMQWGYDPKDKGCSYVFYYDGSLDNLEIRDFPLELDEESYIPEYGISYSCKQNVPTFEEYSSSYDMKLRDLYDKSRESLDYSKDNVEIKLLGYSDNVQGDMIKECQLVTNGIYCGDADGYNSDRAKELLCYKDNWKLLLQLDTLSTDDYELMFGDSGRIFFFIREEDLRDKRFENSWLILQSC